ncbi:arylsulfatase [Pseudomonas sp. GD03860]|uniref:arylsulfatase n=1 Tax=Pseudomonas TaxID=286 RepID=UPI0023637553|nr:MULTISPECIES: arylsulfatase [Pseudomonas]MDD2056766.1 arylsulfatase [Pseudomonas putida]MDH0638038.1 arylsulfatase [Pseudomonas sp. GD03860]
MILLDNTPASVKNPPAKRARMALTLLVGVSLGVLAQTTWAQADSRPGSASKPNIVILLADNVGYGVPSSYNGGILDTPTPRIDQLAAEGVRLTNFNVENQCTPSRAALLTGRLPIRSGIGKAIGSGAEGGLHRWEITLAEMLGDAGYRTALLGKWHLGTGPGRLPTDQGFDQWFGFETSDVSYWAGDTDMPLRDVDYIREASKGGAPRNLQVYDQNTRRQIDRMVTDRAVEYLAASAKDKRPFFLYVPFAFAHHPVLANPEFKGQSPAGEFGDSLLEHDHNVGRILDALKAAGLDDKTVVVWASDNGPSPLPTNTPTWTNGDAGPWRGEIGTALEGNIRTPYIMRWPGNIPAGRVSNQIVSAVDLFPTIAHIAGGKVPTDRPIDGVDQLDFLTAKQEKSNRESVLVFVGDRLMAVKWRNYKIHMAGLDRVDGVVEEWSFPQAFNLASDPKERFNIIWQNTWLSRKIQPVIAGYRESLKQYPNLAPGQSNDVLPHYGKQQSTAATGEQKAVP